MMSEAHQVNQLPQWVKALAKEDAGVAADIGHINTKSTVTGYVLEQLHDAVSGADIVLIPAGVPRKPGMTRDGTA